MPNMTTTILKRHSHTVHTMAAAMMAAESVGVTAATLMASTKITNNNGQHTSNGNHSYATMATAAAAAAAATPAPATTNATVATVTKDHNWHTYAFISIVAIACYVNGMHGEFVHDDIPAITLNRDVLGTNKIIHVFKNDFWGMPMADANSHKSYRPLTVLTFR